MDSSGLLKFYDRGYEPRHVVQHTSGHDLLISKLIEISVVGFIFNDSVKWLISITAC